ncbi:hypothetical protein D3C86_1757550 [compost metagenome]
MADVVLWRFGFLLSLAVGVATAGLIPRRSPLAIAAGGQIRRSAGGRFDRLLLQALAHAEQPVEFVQLGFSQRLDLLQNQGDAPTDCRQWFLVRQQFVPTALGDPVVNNPDVRQLELCLYLAGFVAAQIELSGRVFDFR